MTFRQKEALDFIKGFWQLYGFAPSYDEIGSALELKSKSGVHRVVRCLVERGWVVMEPHKARSVRVVEKFVDARG
jgi:repressor LexA